MKPEDHGRALSHPTSRARAVLSYVFRVQEGQETPEEGAQGLEELATWCEELGDTLCALAARGVAAHLRDHRLPSRFTLNGVIYTSDGVLRVGGRELEPIRNPVEDETPRSR